MIVKLLSAHPDLSGSLFCVDGDDPDLTPWMAERGLKLKEYNSPARFRFVTVTDPALAIEFRLRWC